VMDVQPNIVSRLPNQDTYLANVQAVVDAAHKNNVPVIYVVVGFRAGLPEVSPRNKAFSAIKETLPMGMIEPRPVLELADNDVLVTKRRVSAFAGSDLEVILRAYSVQHLVLCGIATSGVVLSTTREAADKDYQLTILADLCADMDPEVHSVLLEKVLPRQANVITCAEWVAGFLNKQH